MGPLRALDRARRAAWHLRTGGLSQVREFARRERIAAELPPGRARVRADGSVHYDPWPLPSRSPSRPGLRVGVVLDDFSRLALGYEWEQVELAPDTWRRTLEAEPVDLLLVESAWAGNGGAWRYHLTGPSAPRPAVVELFAWCREQGIPTVFWNKEDPVHLEDFLDVARLADHVFTTDADCLDTYRERLGHDRVGVLPFAAQPALHNPVRAHGDGPGRDVAFAGTYFAHKYPERRAQMDLLLGAAHRASARMEHGLEIYSRFQGQGDTYAFPEPFASRVVGSLSYREMLTAYRDYKVFLNVNTVVASPSMCARRVFEIVASGTPVVSTPAAAIGAVFGPDEVAQVDDAAQAELTLRALVRNPELRDRMVHLAQRRVWAGHTYGHRADQVLEVAGLGTHRRTGAPTRVTALVATRRPEQLGHVLVTVGAQVGVDVRLALLTHGFTPDPTELRQAAARAGVHDLVLLHADASASLGECLNRLVSAADGEVVAKMDDDDLYGPHYLADQVHALHYSGADVVGKHAHFMHLEGPDATVLRFADREHRFTDRVMGPTLVGARQVFLDHPFADRTRGEDTEFLRTVLAAGRTVYAADRFNFVQVRGPEAAEHTWDVSDVELLASGDVLSYGRADAHVMI